MKITVVALGKIGLPLAVQFAEKGNFVFGVDINEKTVELVQSGTEPFPGETLLAEKLKEVIKSGNLEATTDTEMAVANSDVVVVVVPLILNSDGSPDFLRLDSATHKIGKGLKPGTLVSYETTVPVGTTRNRFAKILEKESKLRAGIDFHLAFSPERVSSGKIFADLKRYPKLVGGINEISAKEAKDFYENVLDFDDRNDLPKQNGVWNLGTCESSELAKLVETTYRDVNIGLANQFAKYAARKSIDFQQVIEACNSQPFSHIHQPGISVGGHCIPVYPLLYLWDDPGADIVRASRNVNAGMPQYFIDQLEQIHGTLLNRKVVILGLSYRPGVKESIYSGTFTLASELESKGSHVFVHDSMYSEFELTKLGLNPFTFQESVDIVILHTAHPEYQNLSSNDFDQLQTVVDGRDFLSKEKFIGLNFISFGN